MKKSYKNIIVVVVILLLISLVILYFMPMNLSLILNDEQTLIFSKVAILVQDGVPTHDTTDYSNVSEEQKQQLFALFDSRSYRRNLTTMFSDGSMSGNGGEGYLYMFIYDGTEYIDAVVFAYDDEMSFGNKNYTINNSGELIDGVIKILNS